MEKQINESKEGSGSNPKDNVNVQLAMALTQIAEYFKRQETRAETLEISENVTLERFQKFGPSRFMEKVERKWLNNGLRLWRISTKF